MNGFGNKERAVVGCSWMLVLVLVVIAIFVTAKNNNDSYVDDQVVQATEFAKKSAAEYLENQEIQPDFSSESHKPLVYESEFVKSTKCSYIENTVRYEFEIYITCKSGECYVMTSYYYVTVDYTDSEFSLVSVDKMEKPDRIPVVTAE